LGQPTDGENGGDADLSAEVYVGRAPVATVEQVRTFVEKTIRCETQSNPNLTNALLMAMYLGEFPTGPCQGADRFNGLLPLLNGWSMTRDAARRQAAEMAAVGAGGGNSGFEPLARRHSGKGQPQRHRARRPTGAPLPQSRTTKVP